MCRLLLRINKTHFNSRDETWNQADALIKFSGLRLEGQPKMRSYSERRMDRQKQESLLMECYRDP